MREGIESELAGIALGDERLNKRSVQVLKALASDPQASINAACDGWGDTVAAYRLFNNPSVAPEKALAPHFEATRTLELKQTPKRAARQAKIEIRALRVTMQSPRDRRDSSLPPVTFNLVLAEEIDDPAASQENPLAVAVHGAGRSPGRLQWTG